MLVYESPGRKVLDSPDNLVFTPRGGIVLCEDDASDDADTHPLAPGLVNINRLIGLDPGGEPFEFAVNITDDSEFAGACFSPDGLTMFVNTFGTGTPDAPGAYLRHPGSLAPRPAVTDVVSTIDHRSVQCLSRVRDRQHPHGSPRSCRPGRQPKRPEM